MTTYEELLKYTSFKYPENILNELIKAIYKFNDIVKEKDSYVFEDDLENGYSEIVYESPLVDEARKNIIHYINLLGGNISESEDSKILFTCSKVYLGGFSINYRIYDDFIPNDFIQDISISYEEIDLL
ncbi:MAG: hypothetical protein RR144_04600 [Clostridia bacterium]